MREWLYKISGLSTRPSKLFQGGRPHEPVPATQHEFSQLPSKAFAEHCAIIAPTGWGKSELLKILITRFVAEEDSPALFIIDNQGSKSNAHSLLTTLEILYVFDQDEGIYKDRLVVLDPEDESPPALNLFKMGDANDATVNELFQYLFTAIDSTLTSQQSTTVTYLLRLMSQIPNATIDTLRKVMEDKAKTADQSAYHAYIQKLDPIARDFFSNQFYTAGAMQVTRNSVARRLYALLSNPVFLKIFGATENKFDAVRAFRKGQVVLMNTSQKLLGNDSAVLGRYYIAQILAAAYRKGDSSRGLLIIDEAWQYLDEKTELILDTARKFGLGLIIATQRLDKIPKSVQSSIYANTAVKFAGAVAHDDANVLAREMHCDPEFIQGMTKVDRSHSYFAVYVRSVTKHAEGIQVPFGALEEAASVTMPQYDKFREINRRRYGTHEAPERASRDQAQSSSISDMSVQEMVNAARKELGIIPDTETSTHTVLPDHYQITLPDFQISSQALLDSGAAICQLYVTTWQVIGNIVHFTLEGRQLQAYLKGTTQVRGVGGITGNQPIITTRLTVASHTDVQDFVLTTGFEEHLVGRPFLAGRILVESAHKRW